MNPITETVRQMAADNYQRVRRDALENVWQMRRMTQQWAQSDARKVRLKRLEQIIRLLEAEGQPR